MLQKGFLRSQTTRIRRDNHLFYWVNRAILYLGVAILIAALIFMIINLNKADTVVNIWLLFMAAGVFLVFISQLIQYLYSLKS